MPLTRHFLKITGDVTNDRKKRFHAFSNVRFFVKFRFFTCWIKTVCLFISATIILYKLSIGYLIYKGHNIVAFVPYSWFATLVMDCGYFFFKMIKISFFKKITEVEIFDTVSVFAMNVHVSLQACRCLLREVCVRIQNNVILCYHSFYSSALRWLNFNSVVEFSVWRNDVVGGIKCLVVIPHSIASHSESRIVVASKGKKMNNIGPILWMGIIISPWELLMLRNNLILY